MKSYGIRISDGKGEVLSPTLYDILKEIKEGDSYYWSILFLDGTPTPGQGPFLAIYKKEINDSEHGVLISWDDLCRLSNIFFQMFEVIVLGSKDATSLHRYVNEEEMQNTCDIVIYLIDCAFWEVYSKNQELIDTLKKKFKETEYLDPNNTNKEI